MTKPPLSEEVASSVRAELARRKLSAGDIAPVLSLDVRTAQRRLAGKTPFTLDELDAVAAFLGVTVDAFFPRAVAMA